jgi:hypothetical protein
VLALSAAISCASAPKGDQHVAEPPEHDLPPGPSEAEPAQATATVIGEIAWSTSVESLDVEPVVGTRFDVYLPPLGERNALWGTYVYSSDSSIGTAAVQMGLMTYDSGGVATIQIAPGREYYLGSEMNGVRSSSYSAWDLSYGFIVNGQVLTGPEYQLITWDMSSVLLPDGVDIKLELPPVGQEYPAWGTDTYTSDSSIGTAAVHAGLITFAGGGIVTIRKVGAHESYEGSTRNGVTTSSYGAWDQSFVFVR